MLNSTKNKHLDNGSTFEKKHLAKVIHCETGKITLSIERHSSCSGCQQQSSCAHRQTENLLNKEITLTLEKDAQYPVGDYVHIDLDEKTLLLSAFLIYCVPILAMIVVALVASLFTQDQTQIFIASILALLASLFLIKKYCKQYAHNVLGKIEIKK